MPFSASGRWQCSSPRARRCSSLRATTTTDKLPTVLLAVPTALAFIGSGIIARSQRPSNATGILLIVVGFAWALGALTAANNEYVFTAGLVLGTVFTALLAHLFLAFPTGRLTNRTDRRIVGVFYAVVLVGPLLVVLFDEGEISTTDCDGPCPENVLSLVGAQPLANGSRARLRVRLARARGARARPDDPALAPRLARPPPHACARVRVGRGPDRGRSVPVDRQLLLRGALRRDQLAHARCGARSPTLVALRTAALPLHRGDAPARRRAVGEAQAGRGAGGAAPRAPRS